MGDFRVNALYVQACAYLDRFQPQISDANARVSCFVNSYFAALTPWGYIQNQLPSTERIYAIIQNTMLGIACVGLIISVGLWCVGRTQLMVVTAVLSCASAGGAFMAYQAASLATYSEIAKDLERQVDTFKENNTTLTQSNAALQENVRQNTNALQQLQLQNATLQESNAALERSVNQSEAAVAQLRLQLTQLDLLLKAKQELDSISAQERVKYATDQNALLEAMQSLIQHDLAASVKKTQEARLMEANAVGKLEVTQQQLSTTQQQLEATHRKFAETVEILQSTGQDSAKTGEALAQILREAQALFAGTERTAPVTPPPASRTAVEIAP